MLHFYKIESNLIRLCRPIVYICTCTTYNTSFTLEDIIINLINVLKYVSDAKKKKKKCKNKSGKSGSGSKSKSGSGSKSKGGKSHWWPRPPVRPPARPPVRPPPKPPVRPPMNRPPVIPDRDELACYKCKPSSSHSDCNKQGIKFCKKHQVPVLT